MDKKKKSDQSSVSSEQLVVGGEAVRDEQLAEGSGQSASTAPAASLPRETLELRSVNYGKGVWNGMETFQCAHCEFDTLKLEQMTEHLFWVHSIMEE